MKGGRPSPRSRLDPVETDLVRALTGTLRFRTFVLLAVSSALIDDLRGPGPWVVFAPTDEAFARLAPGVLEALLAPDAVEARVDLVENHVCRARPPGMPWVSLLGEQLAPTRTGERHACRNGTLVTLDRVLVPRTDPSHVRSLLRLCRS